MARGTDSTIAPPQNQRFSSTNVSWRCSTQGRVLLLETEASIRFLVCKGLSIDDVRASRDTMFREIRPGAGFKTGHFDNEMLGGATRRTTRGHSKRKSLYKGPFSAVAPGVTRSASNFIRGPFSAVARGVTRGASNFMRVPFSAVAPAVTRIASNFVKGPFSAVARGHSRK